MPDVLFHLPNKDVITVLANFANSEIPYLLTTTYTFPKRNEDVKPGGFRFINLQLPPFLLPPPLSRMRRFRGSGATPLPRALVTRPSEIGSRKTGWRLVRVDDALASRPK